LNIQFGSVLNEQNSFVIWDEIGQGIFTVPKLPTWFRKHLRGSGSIDLKGFRSEKLNLTTWCCTRCFEGLSRSAFNNVKLKSLQAALGKEKQAEATMLGDNKQTLTPACHEQIENEANFAAGQMLFFQQAFVPKRTRPNCRD